MMLDINDATITAGKHVPPGPLSVANYLSKAVRAATLEITLDAKQGIELVQLIQPDVTIPIHYE